MPSCRTRKHAFQFCSPGVVFKLKIRHSAIVEKIVTDLCAKLNDDR